MNNSLSGLIAEFQSIDLIVDSPILDGKIKRVGTTDKPKSKNGWYIGWSKLINGKDYICCSIGDWTLSNEALTNYKSWQDDDNGLSNDDLAELKKHQAELQKKAEVEKAKRHKEAAKNASQQWLGLFATGNSAYLLAKQVKGYGIKYGQDDKEGDFIAIPIRDHDNNIKGLQCIYDKPLSYDPDRNKTFTAGVEKKGNFHVIGELSPFMPLCFAEGYATAASVYEATGYAVVVCFDAGNIAPVVASWRVKYPQQQFIICADNDQWKQSNTGIDKATKAAKAHNCYLAIPEFKDTKKKGWLVHGLGFMCFSELKLSDIKPTDFNDLHLLAGLNAVKTAINQASSAYLNMLKPVVKSIDTATPAPHPQHPQHNTILIDDDEEDEADYQAKEAEYPVNTRPCYRVYDDWWKTPKGERKIAGVYYHWVSEDKEGNQSLVDSWVCSPLYIQAMTYDQHGNNYGRFLCFKTPRGAWRKWCMPMAMLKGSCDELRGELLSMGVKFNIQDRKSLIRYLTWRDPDNSIEITTQTGWHKEAYILPDRCIGSEKYFYQSETFHTDIPYRQSGSLTDWQQNIARYCVDNPLLMLSVCTAFTGALLKLAHQQGGGFHVFGDSSKGKTTGASVACSVFGDETYKRSWKATSNGMEATAAMFNDSLLALDEVSECDPKEVQAIVYAIGNGVGKSRANKSGGSRATNQWRVMCLSNGERSIDDTIKEAGKNAKAGSLIRLLSIPLFGQYGAFNELHDKKDGRELSDYLQTASKKFYGVAGVEYLTKLVNETRNIDQLAEDFTKGLIDKAINETNEPLSSQESRAAKRFALVMLAGELATEYGITGWQEGQAAAGVYECFKVWRKSFGGGDTEDRQVLQSVKDFIDRFCDSRFTNANSDNDFKVNDRAGYWKQDDNGGRVYLFNDYAMSEALNGYGLKSGIDILKRHGWLECEPKRDKKKHRINSKTDRFYTVKLPEVEV